MSNLFDFNSQQLNLSKHLTDKIISIIDSSNNNQIKFSQYMNLALYDINYGYYNNNLYKFGSQGDFITAPNISPLFAYTLNRQLLELFANGVSPCILEFGAGNGDLMLNILAKSANNIEKYYIIELSASLQQLQRDRLIQYSSELLDKVIWLDQLPNEFNGVILANEVLDAQAVEVIKSGKDGVIYQNVSYHPQQGFHFVDGELITDELFEIVKPLNLPQNNYVTEINLTNIYFMRSLNEMLSKGVIILIDYGYPQKEYYISSRHNGSLRGFLKHQVVDNVLQYPGLIDITSSINWSLIAATGIDCGLDLIGYTTQANFLINCGLLDELASARVGLSFKEQLKLSQQVNTLSAPAEMGQAFKVMAFSKHIEFYDFIGFKYREQSYLL